MQFSRLVSEKMLSKPEFLLNCWHRNFFNDRNLDLCCNFGIEIVLRRICGCAITFFWLLWRKLFTITRHALFRNL